MNLNLLSSSDLDNLETKLYIESLLFSISGLLTTDTDILLLWLKGFGFPMTTISDVMLMPRSRLAKRWQVLSSGIHAAVR